MYGFPINSQGSINTFTNNADSGFPKIQQKEVFYSIKDGSWTDPSVWQTVSGRVGKTPASIDDVYIRNNITVVNGFSVNNVFVHGVFNILDNSPQLNYIFGNLKVYGNLIIGAYQILRLYGNDNIITTYSFNATSGISYDGTLDQNILPISYQTLYANNGVKYLNYDLEVLVNFQINNCKFYFQSKSLIVNGTSNIMMGSFGQFFCLVNNANLLFKGLVQIANSTLGDVIDFSGNPNIEFRGGLNFTNPSAAPQFGKTGTGIWSFTTNNQTLQCYGTGVYNCKLVIGSGVTLSISNTYGLNYLNDTINGTDSTSKLLMASTGILYFNTQNAAENSMTIGTWDFTTNPNTIGYVGNYSATIPSYFTTFHNLTISGTGTKTLGVNTTLNGSLTLLGSISSTLYGNLDCSIYNLTVTGTTFFQCGGLYCTGGGNLLFIGNFQSVNGYNTNRISFTGNPNAEFRGGITKGNYDWNGGWNTGTGTWTFSTNNQTFQGASGYVMNNTCKFIVSGAITVTYTSGQLATFSDKINGTVAGSTWVNQGRMKFVGTEITPMATGVFDYLTSTSSYLSYEYYGNQTIPYTSYQGLAILNSSGSSTKSLSGNTSVLQNFELGVVTGTIVECSTYDLTVTGTSYLNGILSKTGAGNVLFIGNVVFGGISANGNGAGFNFSGNPTVEFRNGINPGLYGLYNNVTLGTGTFSFTTNNQSIGIGKASNSFTCTCNLLIDSNIVVTYNNIGSGTLFTGTINGNNSNSKFLIGTGSPSITYNNATQPMATGILDTSTNLNTWIYAGTNQDIKGGPTTGAKQVYRNLRFSTSGSTKTLQGYVSALNTYTLDSGVTVNNNGYTLTNP